MAKIKLTKNELKKQKDALKRFQRYLPTLQLKKQQLQIEVRKIERALHQKEDELERLRDLFMKWVAVLGEEVGLEELVVVQETVTSESNIAGVDIPVFEKLVFQPADYDLFITPVWVDAAVEKLKEMLAVQAEVAVLQEQARLIREELTITTQRVNLFEKVKIPETKENIRVIRIYMGDQQTAAVVRGKISKKKIVEKQAS
jgi:V/A-type H+-transporting ATPase subunit D